MSTTAISEYALLSDRHSAALVARDGSVDWLCFPRFDSPSIFARLVGEPAGHWSIRVCDAQEVTRRYLDGHDGLGDDAPHADRHRRRGRRVGDGRAQPRATSWAGTRRISCSDGSTCTQGEVELEVEYAPRPEYGLVFPLLEASTAAWPPAAGPTS